MDEQEAKHIDEVSPALDVQQDHAEEIQKYQVEDKPVLNVGSSPQENNVTGVLDHSGLV